MKDFALVETLNKRIDDVHNKIESIDEKVDQLLEFKWQIIGGSLVLSSILSITITIILSKVG